MGGIRVNSVGFLDLRLAIDHALVRRLVTSIRANSPNLLRVGGYFRSICAGRLDTMPSDFCAALQEHDEWPWQ